MPELPALPQMNLRPRPRPVRMPDNAPEWAKAMKREYEAYFKELECHNRQLQLALQEIHRHINIDQKAITETNHTPET